MRIPVIAGNWKMNTTLEESVKLVKAIAGGLPHSLPLEVVVCPPFISLAAVKSALDASPVMTGAQNMYCEDKGAFTGEISPLMLKGLCRYVILGHSERRAFFKEADELISRKIKSALQHGFQPILCVGENLAQYEAGQTEATVSRQIKKSLQGIDSIDTLTVAYEPVWAIGTGKAATGSQANQTIRLIRLRLADRYGAGSAEKVRILYGGSVTPANIAEFVSQSDIDGGLVGGASLKAAEFLAIIHTTLKTHQLN